MNSNRPILNPKSCDRRSFLGQSAVAAAVRRCWALGCHWPPRANRPQGNQQNTSGKSSWGWSAAAAAEVGIAKLFQNHGGYEMHGVADYFPEVAKPCGDTLGVDPVAAIQRALGLPKTDCQRHRSDCHRGRSLLLPGAVPSRPWRPACTSTWPNQSLATVPGCLAMRGQLQAGHSEKAVFSWSITRFPPSR